MTTPKSVRFASVECQSGWRFTTITLRWAEVIMEKHECANFVLTGDDRQAFELAHVVLAAETGKENGG